MYTKLVSYMWHKDFMSSGIFSSPPRLNILIEIIIYDLLVTATKSDKPPDISPSAD